jgi:hypothetical protein
LCQHTCVNIPKAAANGNNHKNAANIDGSHPPAVGANDTVAGILPPQGQAWMTASMKTTKVKPAMTTLLQSMPTHTNTHNMSLASDS